MVSKRERAKQRKAAAATKSTTTNNAKLGPGIRHESRQIIKAMNKFPTTRIVELVKKGDGVTTTALSDAKIKGISYQKSGLLSAVLGLLQRCEHESFDEVIDDVSFLGHGNVPWNEESYLDTPSTWIGILMEAKDLEPSCMLQIAENIAPLVRCMSDDASRTFFKSNTHWKEGIVSFAELIYYLLSTKVYGSQIINVLLKHECLLRCVIQWAFWNEHRPDIVKELPAADCRLVNRIGDATAKFIIAISAESCNWQQVKTIGSMSIINKDYDASCMVSYVEGFVRQMNKQDNSWDEQEFILLKALINHADCVDGGVINGIIRYDGTSITSDLVSADRRTILSYTMILQKTDTKKYLPCDTRTAAAVRAGSIEMCLNFIGRVGDHESSSSSKSLFDNIENTFKMIHAISLHQKTAKAIRSKRQDIEFELVRLEQKSKITNNSDCNQLLDMVRSTLDINGSYCCRCNKSLSKTEVLQCNGCGHMTYCSRACQQEDWFIGHSVTCCSKSFTHKEAGHFQGRILPLKAPDNERDARKMEEVEKNITMIQLKLFLDHSETILKTAKALNIPVCDCVVKFDLRCYPPRVAIKCYTEFFQTNTEYLLGFEKSRSEDNIMCIYTSSLYIGDSEERLAMQRFFPHKWLVEQSK